MLINFRFDNFLSINELVEFSMVPGRTKGLQESLINLSDHKKLLKISAIYGANASGKSSFIKALLYARFLIVNGFQDKLVFTSSFNKNKPDNKRKESRFEFEIVVGNRTYSYGFSVILSERKFIKEWLYDVTDEETLIYTVNRELQDLSQKFQRMVLRKFDLEKLSTKLQEWYLLDFSDFIKELKRLKVKLSLSQESEWEEYFLEEKSKAVAIDSEIKNTDKEIDSMVYRLYDLTDEEIKIIEEE